MSTVLLNKKKHQVNDTLIIGLPLRIAILAGALGVSGFLFYYEIYLRFLTILSFTRISGPLSNPDSVAIHSSLNGAMLVSAIFLFVSILVTGVMFFLKPRKRFVSYLNVVICLVAFVIVKLISFCVLASLVRAQF